MFEQPRAILVPTDFSEFSDNALRYALDIAAQYNATVYLLHVLSERVYSDHTITLELIETLKKRRMEDAENLLGGQLAKFPQSKNLRVVKIVRTGLDYEEILRVHEELGVDLIVIASHGQTGLLSLFVGSVAEKVARGAKCPVLLVRSQPPGLDIAVSGTTKGPTATSPGNP
jgi:universal stress protein A